MNIYTYLKINNTIKIKQTHTNLNAISGMVNAGNTQMIVAVVENTVFTKSAAERTLESFNLVARN